MSLLFTKHHQLIGIFPQEADVFPDIGFPFISGLNEVGNNLIFRLASLSTFLKISYPVYLLLVFFLWVKFRTKLNIKILTKVLIKRTYGTRARMTTCSHVYFTWNFKLVV